MTPKLSLVTGAYNRPQGFLRLLKSIIEHTQTPWELVVSDCSDEPLTCELENVRILPERPRQGHSRGYNCAFRECRGEFVLWLNDDSEVCPGYDVEAIDFMELHPNIGLGALHYSENGGPFRVNESWSVVYANFGIFRREAGEQVGFFDEAVSMYGADNSFTFRMLMADYGVSDIPKARILHHSEDDHIRKENQSGRIKDNRILTDKYMPHIRAWQAAYKRHRVDTGTVPWVHGQPPKLVRV